MVLYGTAQGAIEPFPTPTVHMKPTLGELMGVNGFIDNDRDLLSVVGNVREYHSWISPIISLHGVQVRCVGLGGCKDPSCAPRRRSTPWNDRNCRGDLGKLAHHWNQRPSQAQLNRSHDLVTMQGRLLPTTSVQKLYQLH